MGKKKKKKTGRESPRNSKGQGREERNWVFANEHLLNWRGLRLHLLLLLLARRAAGGLWSTRRGRINLDQGTRGAWKLCCILRLPKRIDAEKATRILSLKERE